MKRSDTITVTTAITYGIRVTA